MDTAYTWHPGAIRVNATWPVPVHLLPDEILSSWLVRTALALGCDPLVLTGDIWPGWRVWTLDVDRQISSQRVIQLSRKSGMPVSALQLATLSPIEIKVLGDIPPIRQVWPWITTTGARNRLRNGGMQYCSACLASDRVPYFRLQWRLAWHTGCQVHGCYLLDRCPHCHAPIEPHRVVPEHSPITTCPSCFGDLRQGGVKSVSDHAAMAFQMEIDHALKNGMARIGDLDQPVSIWMDVAHFYMVMLKRFVRYHSRATESFIKDIGIAILPANSMSPLTLEMGTVKERAWLMAAVHHLMMIPLEKTVSLMEANDLSQQAICPKGIRSPKIISDAVLQLRDAGRKKRMREITALRISSPRSCHDVGKMMYRLRVRIARRSL